MYSWLFDRGWWVFWDLGWLLLLPLIFTWIGLIYLLDWAFPKKKPGTWLTNRIGA